MRAQIVHINVHNLQTDRTADANERVNNIDTKE